MAVTGSSRGILLAYTKKGVHEIEVPFDAQWWGEALRHLRTFWKTALYPAFMAALSLRSPAHEPEPADVDPQDEPADVDPQDEPADVDPQNEPADVDPQDEPADVDPQNEPADVDPQNKPADVDPQDKPADVDPQIKPADVNPPDEHEPAVTPAHEPADVTPANEHESAAQQGTFPHLADATNLQDLLVASMRAEQWHQQDVEMSLAEYAGVLETKYNYCIDGVTPSDGNCFFSALSNQMVRMGMSYVEHSILRSVLCDFLDSLSDEEKEFMSGFLVGKTFDTYVQDMRRNGTYADHMAVMYTSQALGMPITVFDKLNKISFGDASSASVLHVGYISELNHYVSVIPK
jgi:hypothetical protein